MAKTNNEKVKEWRKRTKDRIIEAMGGECICCGYNKCSASLTLHHINPSDKEFGFGAIRGNPKSWFRIVNELRKCVLVCANCHGEIEHNDKKLPKKYKVFDESYSTYYLSNSNLKKILP